MSRDSASTTSSTFAFGPGTGAFSSSSNNSTSSPSSRRSSANLAAGTEKFSRLGQGLPTVAEIEQHHAPPERPTLRHNSSSNSSNASSATSISTAASSTRLSVVSGG